MSNSTYHRILRVFAAVLAITLVFESGLISESTAVLSKNTHSYLANAVGVKTSVAPTELNMYTAKLTQMERDLEAREAALAEREISVGLSSNNEDNNQTSTYILATILFILLVLILLNYVLDYARAREEREQLATASV